MSAEYASEQFRRESEARHWLGLGYNSPIKIDELREKITKRRGKDCADELINEMRRQWKK